MCVCICLASLVFVSRPHTHATCARIGAIFWIVFHFKQLDNSLYDAQCCQPNRAEYSHWIRTQRSPLAAFSNVHPQCANWKFTISINNHREKNVNKRARLLQHTRHSPLEKGNSYTLAFKRKIVKHHSFWFFRFVCWAFGSRKASEFR